MARSIAGVVVGYIVIFLVVFLTFSAAYLMMGQDLAFREGSYVPSMLWSAVSIVLGLVAAVAGGWVCMAIARKKGAVSALVVVVLILGVVTAIPSFTAAGTDQVRSGTVSNMEAMMQARTPAWMALLNIVIGVVGVMAGSRLKKVE